MIRLSNKVEWLVRMGLAHRFGGGGDPGAAARQQQLRQQAEVSQSMNLINSVFEGGSVPTYNAVAPGTAFDPNTTYYKPFDFGTQYKPLKGTAGEAMSPAFTPKPVNAGGQIRGAGGGGESTATTPTGKVKPGLFTAGTPQTFEGYTPAFYQKAAQDYLAATMPQLGQQFQTTEQQLGEKVANQGLFGSTIAKNLDTSLQTQGEFQKQNLAEQAQGYSSDLQKQIESYRNQLVNQVQTAADPASAAISGLKSVSTFATPNAVQPLQQMFGNWANTYLAANLAGGSNPGGGALYVNPYP